MSLTGKYYEAIQQEFLDNCELVDNGEISFLDMAVQFYEEMKMQEQQAKDRKDWLNENRQIISSENEGYGNEGYKGLKFTIGVKETYTFDHIPEYDKLKKRIKEIETKSKLALKNGFIADENGEEIILPKLKSATGFIKTDKVRK